MTNLPGMRRALLEVYSGDSWKARVQKMNSDQVFAIYKRLERNGELYPHNRRAPAKETDILVENLMRDNFGRNVVIFNGP